ncbi:MAG: DUF4367 domain-containing protein [Candidatus Saccharimonadales bacterium]
MKCSKCQKSDFNTIHGRKFCANCSEQAEERLSNFQIQDQTSPHKIGNHKPPEQSDNTAKPSEADIWLRQSATIGNVLDLSQSKYDKIRQISTQTSPPKTPKTKLRPNPNHSLAKDVLNLAVENEDFIKAAESTVNEAPAEAQLSKMKHRHQHKVPKKPIEAASEDLARINLEEDGEEADKKRRLMPKLSFKLPKVRLTNLFNTNFVRVTAVVISMIVLTGYVTYLNYPNMAVRVAASRASIDASMPGYLPTGYSFSGPVAYSPGRLVVNFERSDNDRITLSQSTTRWDSNSLLEEHIKLRTSTFTTYRDKGLTIYTFDGKHAVWVNGGVLYEIEVEGDLDPEEIVRIAGSL